MHEIITLKNGVRIAHEHMPHVRSAAVGIWVGVGSRFERAAENGAAHFIEHMLFKGTKTRSAMELAELMDDIGYINAYTTRDSTCFYARVLDTKLDLTIDVLSDMFFNSLFAEKDIVSERGVIFEEIDMYADTPEDLAVERLTAKVFKGALGRPILGTKRSLAGQTGDSLREFMAKHYAPSRLVISLCGSYTAAQLEHISALFSEIPTAKAPEFRKATYTPALTLKQKPIEQNHICLAFPGIRENDDRRFALSALSSVLGGGMSSRLFQSVREKHGLCYSIYSCSPSHADTGYFFIYSGLSRNSEEKAIRLVLDEVERIRDNGITQDELARALEQAKSSLLLALESTSARMTRLGSSLTMLGSCLTTDEAIAKHDAVTTDDVLSLARELFDFSQLSFSDVGRLAPAESYETWLRR